MIGRLVGDRYRVIRELGRGGMGAVYEAEHTGIARNVALKVIDDERLARSPSRVARFQREARAAAAIDSPYVVQVFDAGVERDSGLPYLAMERLHGEDLAALLERRGPLPIDLALRIVAQACMGVAMAHEAGFIHRDIKPANLFLAQKPEGEVVVKVLDFGLAKDPDDRGAMQLTRLGGVVGTREYMSPEQAAGSASIDRRTDVWSLGAVLRKSITGRNLPEGVARLLERALARDPDRRFATATDMLDAIEPLLPAGWALHEEMLRGSEPRAAVADEPPVPGRRGGARRTLAIAGAIAVVTGGAIALTYAVASGSTQAASSSARASQPEVRSGAPTSQARRAPPTTESPPAATTAGSDRGSLLPVAVPKVLP